MTDAATAPAPAIRSIDVNGADLSPVRDGIQDLYEGRLDVIMIRAAFPPDVMAAVGERLDRNDSDPGWDRPNQKNPVEDIQLIGTPATPTYKAPQGPTLDGYLESADAAQSSARAIFGSFSPAAQFERVLSGLAGGRPVEIPLTPEGRPFAPFTIRRLTEGKGIGLHHDYHYPLPIYDGLAPQADTRTLVSFVVALRKPIAGGELFVYPVPLDLPDPPKKGWSWDLEAVERRFPVARFVTEPGDMFVFASGRCLHRVAPAVGPAARITMGGFLALDKAGKRVLYWS